MSTSQWAYIEFDGLPLFFECVTNEQSEHVSTLSEYAVEEGANVADHMREENPKVTLEVFVSNTPLTDLNGWYGGSTETVELDIPKMAPTIPLSPGAAINALANAISGATGREPVTAQVLTYREALNVTKDMFLQLDEWRKSAVRGKVILPWASLEDMVITRIVPSRSSTTGDAASFAVDFQRVRIVSTAMVTAPDPTESRGQTAQKKGKQPPKAVPESPKKRSIVSARLNRKKK